MCKHILVPLDGSRNAASVLDVAFALARAGDGGLIIVDERDRSEPEWA